MKYFRVPGLRQRGRGKWNLDETESKRHGSERILGHGRREVHRNFRLEFRLAGTSRVLVA